MTHSLHAYRLTTQNDLRLASRLLSRSAVRCIIKKHKTSSTHSKRLNTASQFNHVATATTLDSYSLWH